MNYDSRIGSQRSIRHILQESRKTSVGIHGVGKAMDHMPTKCSSQQSPFAVSYFLSWVLSMWFAASFAWCTDFIIRDWHLCTLGSWSWHGHPLWWLLPVLLLLRLEPWFCKSWHCSLTLKLKCQFQCPFHCTVWHWNVIQPNFLLQSLHCELGWVEPWQSRSTCGIKLVSILLCPFLDVINPHLVTKSATHKTELKKVCSHFQLNQTWSHPMRQACSHRTSNLSTVNPQICGQGTVPSGSHDQSNAQSHKKVLWEEESSGCDLPFCPFSRGCNVTKWIMAQILPFSCVVSQKCCQLRLWNGGF